MHQEPEHDDRRIIDMILSDDFEGLATAIRHGKFRINDLLVHEGIGSRFPAMYWAASAEGSAEMIRAIAAHGGSTRKTLGAVPMESALLSEKPSHVEALLEIDPALANIQNIPALAEGSKTEWTPLMYVARRLGDVGYQMAEVLLKHHADPSVTNIQGENALMIAASWCRARLVPLLIRSGCPVNQRSNLGDSAIKNAAFLSGSSELKKKILWDLLAADAVVDQEDYSRLISARCTDKGLHQAFLKQGASINGVDLEGDTPLHVDASRPAQLEVTRLLLELDANPEAINPETEETAIDRAIFLGNHDKVDFMRSWTAERRMLADAPALIGESAEKSPGL